MGGSGPSVLWIGAHPTEEGFPFCFRPPDIEPSQVEGAVRWIYRSLEQGIVQSQGQGRDAALRDELVDLGMYLEEARRIERQKDRLIR